MCLGLIESSFNLLSWVSKINILIIAGEIGKPKLPTPFNQIYLNNLAEICDFW